MRKNLKITRQDQKKFNAYENIKINGMIFQFKCSLTEGSSSMGFNTDLCARLFSPKNGFEYVVDNRFLNIELKNGYGFEGQTVADSLSKIFDKFEKYIKELVLL